MNRRSVIRCILGLAAAPKILAEIDFKPIIAVKSTANLFNDLNFVIPDYLPKILGKYGSMNFNGLMEAYGNMETIKGETNYYWFEMRPKIMQL